MTTPIDTFLAQYAGLDDDIRAALAQNDAPGGARRNKFDVVADLIFRPREALPVLKIADWSTVKRSYAGSISPFNMLLLLAYRKRYVDQAVNSFCKKCQGRAAPPCPDHPFPKSLGSTDLTSDYDITVGYTRVETSGAELDQIQNFNDHVRLKFGKQPGTIFDTNLYAKDFLPLNDDDARLAMPGVGKDMYNMMVEGQDVGALVKLRRYMPNEDWLAFLEALLRDVDALNSGAVAATRNRYETADAQYLLNLNELLGEFTDRAENKTAKLTREDAAQYQRAIETVEHAVTKEILSPAERRFVSNSARPDMAEVQLLLRHKALKWEHDDPDLVLWATNDLYVKKMKAIRNYQWKLGATGNPAAGDVRVADLISSAIFFASEAYSSEGAAPRGGRCAGRQRPDRPLGSRAGTNRQRNPDELDGGTVAAIHQRAVWRLLERLRALPRYTGIFIPRSEIHPAAFRSGRHLGRQKGDDPRACTRCPQASGYYEDRRDFRPILPCDLGALEPTDGGLGGRAPGRQDVP